MNSSQLLLFLLTSFIVIITPGQDMILVISRSISQGKKAGIATAAGISTGLIGHTLLAAFGLGALLQISNTLFIVVKIIGASYLFYLGLKLFNVKKSELELYDLKTTALHRLYLQGAISNISNPKIAIFYFAFLPQFISVESSTPTINLLVLGFLFSILTLLIKAPIGYIAGSLSIWLRNNKLFKAWLNKISGIVLIILGLKLVLSSSK